MPADGSCKSCVKNALVRISYDPENPTDWLELPAIQKIVKSFEEETATETRHSGSGGAFVKPCGADSRTDVYTIDHLVCDADPIEWYLRDGDVVFWQMIKGKEDPHDKFVEVFQGKYIDGGYTWDNTTKDGEVRTFTVERTGTLTRYYPDSPNPGTDPYAYGDGSQLVISDPLN